MVCLCLLAFSRQPGRDSFSARCHVMRDTLSEIDPAFFCFKPLEEEQGSLRVRQRPPTGEKIVDPLAGQPQKTGEPGFVSVAVQLLAQGRNQLIPEWCIDAGAKRPAAGGRVARRILR